MQGARGLGRLAPSLPTGARSGIDPAIAAGADFGGGVSLASSSIDPAIAAGADFGGGVAAPSSLPSLSTALTAGGALIGTGLGTLDLSKGQVGPGLGKIAGAASLFLPPPFNIMGAVGLPIIGGLFGNKGKSHAQRESEEAARDIGATGGFSQDLSSVKDIESLFAAGLPWMSGYVGGSRTPAVSVDTPLPREFLDLPTTEFNLENGLARVPYLFGTKNSTYPTVRSESRSAALNWIAQHPENLSIQLQSGISQGLKDQFNQPFLSQLQTILASLGSGKSFPRIETRPEQRILPAPPPSLTPTLTPPPVTWPIHQEFGDPLPWSYVLNTAEPYSPLWLRAKEMENFSTGGG